VTNRGTELEHRHSRRVTMFEFTYEEIVLRDYVLGIGYQ
jgi:hypothetical protein